MRIEDEDYIVEKLRMIEEKEMGNLKKDGL